MDFRILGPLEVIAEGRDVAPRRMQQRAVLALLLIRANEIVSADDLIEALWGDEPPETAASALQGHVSALRKVLGASRIETRPPGYLLRLAHGELDAERFASLAAEARATKDAPKRLKLLQEVFALWRGAPLAEFGEMGFAVAEIARLAELRANVLEERVDAELALGRHHDLLPELDLFVRAHPLRERLRGQLMLALYRESRLADALHVYQDGRKVATEELGLDPGPMLQTLERQMLAHDPALDLPVEPPHAPQQARKQVTILVVELSGRTELDPEEFERRVGPALHRARHLVEQFGGTTQPLFANALLAVFGAPRAHEDDRERAVRAAIAMRDSIGEHDGLASRIGIDIGRALVTVTGDRIDVTGEVLGAASRLQAMAPSGGVLVADAVRRATSDAIEYEPSPTGWTARAPRTAVPAPHAGGHETLFVGREHELAIVLRAAEHAAASGTVQLVTVIGEPGSGKTRLVEELRLRLPGSRQWAWREGRCLPYGDGVTFWAMGKIVKAHAGIADSDGPDISRRKLRAMIETIVVDPADRVWLEESLSSIIGVAGRSADRHELFAALRHLVETIAARGPLVLVVEDLHWADAVLLEFIDQLVARAPAVPLMVIGTARLELLQTDPRWSGGKKNATMITLQPLSDRETREVFRSVLDVDPPDDLVKRAGGNPLFAQELARIAGVAGAPSAPIPESIDALIAARLDTLAPEVWAAACDAAVFGEVFWSGAVSAIGGEPKTVVDGLLQRLVAADVIRRARTSSVSRQGEYTFLHGLVRDVAYEQIPRRARAHKHEAAAKWIEELAGDRVIDHADFIVHHYAAAMQLSREYGEDRPDLVAKTVRSLMLAGDRAMRLDVVAAERFYRRALELLSADDPERAALLVRIALAAQESGKLAEALSLCEEAIADLRLRGDRPRLADTLVQHQRALWRRGRTREARNVLAEAVELLEREPAGFSLAWAYTQLAFNMNLAGRPFEGLRWSEKALALAAELGLEDRVAPTALLWRGSARCMLNDLRGLEDQRAGLRLALMRGLGYEAGIGYVNVGEAVWWIEGPLPSLEVYAAGIEFSERHGLEHNLRWLRMDTLKPLFDLGRWDELVGLADELLHVERARGETYITPVAISAKASVLVRRGAIAEAKTLVETFLQPARAIDDPEVLAPALACAAVVESAHGDGAAAIRLVDELEGATRERTLQFRSRWLPDAARVCAAEAEFELTRRLLRGPDLAAPRDRYAVLTARAVLAEAEGGLGDALDAFTEVSARWRDFGNVPEEGYALLGQGRCLLRLDRADEAAAPLAQARRIFERVGALPLVLKGVDELLARAPAQ